MKLLSLCIALGAGELIGFGGGRFAELAPFVGWAAVLIGLYGYGFAWRGWVPVSVFLAGVLLAFGVLRIRREILRAACELNGVRPYTAVVTVAEPVTANSFFAAIGPVKVKVVLAADRLPRPPRLGERWECTGWLERTKRDDPAERRNFWIKGRGTSARCVRETEANGLTAALQAFRRECSRRLGIGVRERIADMNRAILLGERRRMAAADKEAFVAAGTIHIFAISGLHVMTIAGVLAFGMRLLGVPYRWTGLGVIPLLWGYVLMIGSPPSAVRAAAMASLQVAAPLGWRRPNALVAWSLTFLLVYGLDPMKCFDVGCALSFVVMLALLLGGECLGFSAAAGMISRVGISAVAWLAGVPIAAHVFGRLTPGGVVANLLLVPAVGVSVIASLAAIAASFVSEVFAAYVNNFAALVTEAMAGVSYVVAALPGANLPIEPWPLAMCFAWYLAFALALWLTQRLVRRRRQFI